MYCGQSAVLVLKTKRRGAFFRHIEKDFPSLSKRWSYVASKIILGGMHSPTTRRHMKSLRVTVCLMSLYSAAAPAQLDDSYRFLVTARSNGGVLDEASLPLSFSDSVKYWGEYVCRLPAHDCAVRDIYNDGDYSLTPAPGLAGELQVERVNVHHGSNIYDAAAWQIAVMLGSVVNGFALPDKQDPYAFVMRQSRRLSDAAARAVTRNDRFIYNGRIVTRPQQAYAYRMLSRSFLVADPFKDSHYAAWISTTPLPVNPDYQRGNISWTDWKPFTGENAWAFLIGPLQAAYVHYVLALRQAYVPFDELALQNALQVLPSFAAMQAPLGAVYYAPQGTIANRGKLPAHPYEVAVENNASLYAGLNILRATLQVTRMRDAALSAADKSAIDEALERIDVMINGGRLDAQRSTAGLLSFFRHAAWRDGEFVQGGIANDPTQSQAWVPTLKSKAVDANTWTVAALGAARIDDWFGFGAAYRNWQDIKTWGGYGQAATLWGVGFSDRDGNGKQIDGSYRQGVLSAEWTAGAINMVRNLLRHYRSVAPASHHHAVAQDYVRTLEQDEAAMLAGVARLRFDRYMQAQFPGRPANYAALFALRSHAYLYASKRYAIPFGWYANPLPSTAATAWMVMLADEFDPLSYAGGQR